MTVAEPDVVIVGVGYVGLTLAASLADHGLVVWGYDRNAEVIRQLNAGRSHLLEPGVEEVLRERVGRNLVLATRLPRHYAGLIILCVSTPLDAQRRPDLSNLRAAVEQVAGGVADGALVMVRSTVPVGTCRNLVLPVLRASGRTVHLACCPERTIQGKALQELRTLPQVVGALDATSQARAIAMWQQAGKRVVVVNSLEAAEAVKLINNCHTDVLYAFGNEVAMIAHQFGLDPMELIHAANVDYPRPDLARPGFVAGPCLSKDPFLLLDAFTAPQGYRPRLIESARALNERLPELVATHVVQCLRRVDGLRDGCKVLVCGFAYKGWPVTDDIRGTPTAPLIAELRRSSLRVYGHDYVVEPDTIAAMGAIPVTQLRHGFEEARAVVVVNEHPDYRSLSMAELVPLMARPAVLYDCWRLFHPAVATAVPGIHYAGIGYG